MTHRSFDPFGVRRELATANGTLAFYSLPGLANREGIHLEKLPFSLRVLLENVVRNCGKGGVTAEDAARLCRWDPAATVEEELPFMPGRIVLQDFTGVPVLVDLAAMRAAMARLGGDPKRINPRVPVDLVIDHSIQVDQFGSAEAQGFNLAAEFRRNAERYRFLKWGQRAVTGLRVVPPATGIVHQVNLEYLSDGVLVGKDERGEVAYPDTLVGTDSHTTMINGLGVLGWGVGGIEAEACMLGQPLAVVMPKVVGLRLTGGLCEGVTATDLVLTVTQLLRRANVVDQFVEFTGPGLASLSLADRATLGNMAPEYGATVGFFPVDDETLDFLRRTGRPPAVLDRVERYAKTQGLFRSADAPEPIFSRTLELDLATVEPSLAGPKRPQDRIALAAMKASFAKALATPVTDRGFGLKEEERTTSIALEGSRETLRHGAVVIAAITSCTNTSNPDVLVAAGLLAKRAVEAGLAAKPWVKTSFAPGSRAVVEYLSRAGLLPHLERLGFHVVGFGCTTCIGNSGPLPPAVATAIERGRLVAAAVLSGNRNFEGRIHPQVKANYLASPPLCVAYALAGRVDFDFQGEPLGQGPSGQPIHLRDLWPTSGEVAAALQAGLAPGLFERAYADVFEGPEEWRGIQGGSGDLFPFEESSTYIQEPPFLLGFEREPGPVRPILGARVLALLGDSVTTDHISPAGDIDGDSPAGRYLLAQGVPKDAFNSYGSRRGNDRVMLRGTFANVRLKNALVAPREGGFTRHFPSDKVVSIFEASQRYREEGTPLVVLAGRDYGMGSSRDWAAKGTRLLGIRAVLAESFERIHRANLVGMGVLPLEFQGGENAERLGLDGSETLTIEGVSDDLVPRQTLPVQAVARNGRETTFKVRVRLDTPADVHNYRNGGLLPAMLRKFLAVPDA